MAKTKISTKENVAQPGKAMTDAGFKSFLEEGEKGSFLSVEESKKKFSEWRKKHYKL
ncbi:MAG: hypothetical protein ABI388_05760 [Bacteroidia bacterium]